MPDEKKDTILECINLYKSFQTGAGRLDVLKGVDLEVKQGEILAVIGASGVGKSTLLHILGALDKPTRGEVRYGGKSIFSFKDKELARFRNRKIGFVFQFHHLLPEFSALENVMMPRLIAGEEKENIIDKALKLLSRVGIEDRATHRPAELSGGEQQRVAVARALISDPELVIADEPSGNLDQKNAQGLHNLLKELNQNQGYTFVIATHNQSLAQTAERIITLKDGKAVLN
ncbi:MAG TPA: ABC transporter ATP-binding protein [candidate division Zixibacteria bacterium]